MGKRNKKRKKKWKNKNKHIVYLDLSSSANSDEINKIAFEVFGSLYYKAKTGS